MPEQESSGRSPLSERLLFLRSFVTHPRQVGSVMPTSRHAVETMLDMAEFDGADLVVELGAGTGSHTGPILSRLGPEARLLAFEIDPAMAATVTDKLPDPRLSVIAASAEDLPEHLEGAAPEVVVSALPFTSLPQGVGGRILDRVTEVLARDGVLLVLQYSPLLVSELSSRFAHVDRRVSLLNLPPAFLFACRGPRATGGPTSPLTAPDEPTE